MKDDKTTKQLEAISDALDKLLTAVEAAGGDIGLIIQLPNRREVFSQPRSTSWGVIAFERATAQARERLAIIDREGMAEVRRRAEAEVAPKRSKRNGRQDAASERGAVEGHDRPNPDTGAVNAEGQAAGGKDEGGA